MAIYVATTIASTYWLCLMTFSSRFTLNDRTAPTTQHARSIGSNVPSAGFPVAIVMIPFMSSATPAMIAHAAAIFRFIAICDHLNVSMPVPTVIDLITLRFPTLKVAEDRSATNKIS